MEDPAPAPVLPKRPREDEPPVSTPVKQIRSEASTPLSILSVATPSPIKKSPSNDALSSQTAPALSSTQQPAKRRKMTQMEKDDQRLEKEAKAKAREDKKVQKEAEDKLKAEEKQKKMDEREGKKRQKEEEQRAKEEEKAKRERVSVPCEKAWSTVHSHCLPIGLQSRGDVFLLYPYRHFPDLVLTCNQSQMKLNAFFAKPKPGVSPGQVSVESSQHTAALPSSLLSVPPTASTNSAPPSPQKNIVKDAQSDYDRYFLPFNLPAHTILAPRNAFMIDLAEMEAARTRLDSLTKQEDVDMEPATSQSLVSLLPVCKRRGVQTASIVDVIECVNGSSDRPIDVTGDKTPTSNRPLDMLKEIPMKYLHFGRDVRPPYCGTYTRSYTDAEAARLARNPYSRLRQDTNYDYDSEGEWDEPEEGEDLDSEHDEEEDEADDDMEGFLDDEEDPQLKRRLISGDLQPVSSGLCWQDVQGVSRLNDGSGAIWSESKDFTMGILLESQPQCIDPFSTAYWTPESSLTASSTITKDAANGSMNPPRAPLAQRTMNGLLNTLNSPKTPATGSSSKPAKAKRMIPPEQLPAFKAEIEGKDLTKIGMIEALKKVFPKLPKDAISNTLSTVAARVGPTEKEKRWVCIER
jgi:chromatin assembly factor 1 subunit A